MNWTGLIRAYLYGELSSADEERLAAWLRDSPEHRREFVRVSQLEHELAMSFRSARKLAALPAGGAAVRRRFWGARRVTLAFSAVAAAVAVLLAWQAYIYPAPEVSPAFNISGGAADLRGATLRATADKAVLNLGGYCRVEANLGSTLRVDGERLKEKVFLEQGEVSCEVEKGRGAFAVATAIGTVSVCGTKFIVKMLETQDKAGGDVMNQQPMYVKVLAGAVVVAGAWGQLTLTAGEEATVPAAAATAPADCQPLIEPSGTPHVTLQSLDPEPAAGAGVLQPETGVLIRRISDTSKLPAPWNQKWDGKPYVGLENGYAKYPCANYTGEYAIGFGTTPVSALLRSKDGAVLGLIKSKSGKDLGDSHGLHWDKSGKPGTENVVHYVFGTHMYKQDVVKGPQSEEECFTLPLSFVDKGDADWTNDMRYFPMALLVQGDDPKIKDVKQRTRRERIVVYDREENGLLKGFYEYGLNATTVNGIDVSPSGRWVEIGMDMYSMEDIRAGKMDSPKRVAKRAGHGGWVTLADGADGYCWQENTDDWITVANVDTGAVKRLVMLTELTPEYKWGIHVAANRGQWPGWALVSMYGGKHYFSNNVIALEISPAEGAKPRIVRLCSMQNKYMGDRYFTEGFASQGQDAAHVYWGGNWHGTDNLEIYEATLPPAVVALLTANVKKPAAVGK